MRNAKGDIVLDDSRDDAEDDAAFTPERMAERRRKMVGRVVHDETPEPQRKRIVR